MTTKPRENVNQLRSNPTPAVVAAAPAMEAPDPVSTDLPVSRARVHACLASAILWVDELPKYANYQQSKADWWAISAGIVATVTGLAVFPVITDESSEMQKFVVALFAFSAGLCALVPRIKNYAEMAGQARELSAAYGPLVGRLLDGLAAMDAGTADQNALRKTVSDFELAKAKKDTLRYLPRGDKLEAAQTAAKEKRDRMLAG